jgi:hypothetical protein
MLIPNQWLRMKGPYKNRKNRERAERIDKNQIKHKRAERIDIKAERDQPNGEDPKEPRKSRENRQRNEIKINEPKESI